jgi:hypothetical protein
VLFAAIAVALPAKVASVSDPPLKQPMQCTAPQKPEIDPAFGAFVLTPCPIGRGHSNRSPAASQNLPDDLRRAMKGAAGRGDRDRRVFRSASL